MNLKWNKEEIIDLLKSFYKRTYDFDVSISIAVKNNNLYANVENKDNKYILDKESIKEILIDEFKSQNMCVGNIMYDIKNSDEFEGITILVEQNLQLQKHGQ